MRQKLYFKIYLAVLGSIAIFALATGLLWRMLDDREERHGRAEILGQLVQNALSDGQLSAADQQTALEHLTHNLPMNITILGSNGQMLAQVVGTAAEPSALPIGSNNRANSHPQPPPITVALSGGRSALILPPPRRHDNEPPMGLMFGGGLFFLLAAVALTAYPVSRRLTRRLELLNSGVEQWGQGDLSVRVPVRGNDEVAKLAQSFNRAGGQIETLVQTNKMMLANASHELRTPLTRIRMNVEMLKIIDDARQTKRKTDIEQDINELDEMVEGILLSSRLDAYAARHANMPLETVDVLALIAEECAHYDHEDFNIEVEGAPISAQVNPKLLKRLVRNIVENAHKYGESPLAIRVEAGAPQVCIHFQDSGKGIMAANPEQLFEPFVRADGSGQKGVGLGLSLVKKIAERHGGSVSIASAAGEGLHLVVTL